MVAHLKGGAAGLASTGAGCLYSRWPFGYLFLLSIEEKDPKGDQRATTIKIHAYALSIVIVETEGADKDWKYPIEQRLEYRSVSWPCTRLANNRNE